MSGINLNPKNFKDTPLCDLCFEDALKTGAEKSGNLSQQDFKETSIRFCVDGLYKWYKSYAKHYGDTSVFVMVRDASWYWASFCGTDDVMVGLVKEYYSLLKDITEETYYTDLADRMDEAVRVKEFGNVGQHFTLSIPLTCHGVIGDCATALGMSFSSFYQLGLGKALSSNKNELYSKWADWVVRPLFDEVMEKANLRLENFLEVRNTLNYRNGKNVC